ncbi:hypothetical protein Pla111_28970 [Botrimarina hoheduenensis]|uniref:Uncharacterized protein n=1 Tax=Botrimarina hoheduenensis TaxID=2528000 RepID=A0A5C5VV78_9BACT|nr:hypothetical protein Pla111_28970 [Botrimarina hoheduenensis]
MDLFSNDHHFVHFLKFCLRFRVTSVEFLYHLL